MHAPTANRKRRLAAALLASLTAALAACGDRDARSSGAAGGDRPTYTFGVIAKSQSNPVFQAARTGALDAARDLSEEYGVDVRIEWKTPADEDAQRQAEMLRQLVTQGVHGVTISCTDKNILTPVINDAVDAGVEVVTFDSDAPESKRFAYYGVDDTEAGATVMRLLAEAMGGEGVVAVIAGNQAAPNLQARVRGVRQEAAKHPGIEVKYVFYHPETATDAAQKVQTEQQNNPDITGWAMIGGWPLFTANALDGVHQVAKVVAVDHLPPQLEYLRAGQVQALVGQDCYGWGYETVRMLFDKVHKGEEPDEEVTTFDLQIVTPENVEEYEGTWERWLKPASQG